MSKDGGSAKRFVLLGTDYVYPRTTNKILRSFLHSKGITDADIMEEYTPFGHSDYQTIIGKIKKFAAEGKKTAVVSTINGDSNVPFYKELGNQGLKAKDVPVVAFSVGEEELRGVDTKPLVGHLAAWNYFESIKNPTNTAFIKQWTDYSKARTSPATRTSRSRTTRWRPPTSASTCGRRRSRRRKSTDPDKVIAAMAGQTFKAPGGFTSTMDAEEPPPAQAGLHRRDQERRPVQRRLEDARPGQGPAVEPVHPREQGQEGRAREEVTFEGLRERPSNVILSEAKDLDRPQARDPPSLRSR